MSKATTPKSLAAPAGYADVKSGIVEFLYTLLQAAARNVIALMIASYWEIGRRIVEPKKMVRHED